MGNGVKRLVPELRFGADSIIKYKFSDLCRDTMLCVFSLIKFVAILRKETQSIAPVRRFRWVMV